MKGLIITLLYCLICINLYSVNTIYYLKQTGNDAAAGTSDATAWRTIAKANSMPLVSGDSVKLRSGDTFIGTLSPNTSGITYTSYSTGNKPIVTGLITIASWTSLGGNLWEATVAGGLPTLSIVVMNGVLVPMGRFPNADAVNSGYLSYQSFTAYNSITSSSLTGSPDYTNADILIRKQPYTSARAIIMSQSGSTLNFNLPAGFPITSGMGFFIENSPLTLDQNGEWYYDPTTHKIKMYYTGTPPTIQVSTLQNLVNLTSRSNTTIRNINFLGSESHMIYIWNSNNVTIDNCNLQYCGDAGIWHQYTVNFSVTNCTIRDVNMVGINGVESSIGSSIYIGSDTLRNIGMQPGMISKSTLYYQGGSSNGINAFALNIIMERNVIDSVGYCGIALLSAKDGQIIRKNVITNFCGVKNDGGGIYNTGVRSNAGPTGYILIEDNIVSNSLNAGNGTSRTFDPHARGIYLDATSKRVKVLHNTVYHVFEGIYLSQAQDNIVDDNTVFDCGIYSPGVVTSGGLSPFDANPGYIHTRNNTLTNNMLFAKFSSSQLPMFITDVFGGVDSIGTIDNNYYISPGLSSRILNFNSGLTNANFSLPAWRTAHSRYDAKSHITPIVTPSLTALNVDQYLSFFTNASDTLKVLDLKDSIKYDGRGNRYVGQITMPVWSSIVLIDSGFVPAVIQPTADAGSDRSVVVPPTSSVTVTGAGNGGSGSITSVHWVQVSGPANASNSTSNAYTTTFGSLVPGLYVMQFTVTNSQNNAAADYMQITVTAAAVVQPTATAGPDQTITLPVTSTNVTATVNLGTGTVGVYSWILVSGPSSVTFGTPTALSTTINGLITPGTYSLQFTVLNDQGNSVSDNIDILVKSAIPPANQLPIAIISFSQTITLPTNTANVNATGSTDPGGAITAYDWIVTGPNTPTNTTPHAVNTTLGSLIAGVYQVRVKITGSGGSTDTASASLTITVNPAPNVLPTARAGNDIAITLPLDSFMVDASTSTDPDGVTAYHWRQVSGTDIAYIESPNSAITKVIDSLAGVIVLEVRITGSNGAGDTAVDAIQITIHGQAVNLPPVADAGVDQVFFLPRDSTMLIGNGIDLDGFITNYLWSGDGIITDSSSAVTEVKRLTEGDHTYTLIVTDNSGCTASSTVNITVKPAINVGRRLLRGYRH